MILSAFLASLQMSQGPEGRGRRSEIKMKREGKENEREMKVGGVWEKKSAGSFKIHRGDEI